MPITRRGRKPQPVASGRPSKILTVNDISLHQPLMATPSEQLANSSSKSDRIAILSAYDDSKEGIVLLLENQRAGKRGTRTTDDTGTQLTPHYAFRLLNVLFSNDFFAQFISSEDQLTRKELDEGDRKFWDSVAEAFNTNNVNYDGLLSDDWLFDGMKFQYIRQPS
ncbi:hypothetical protein GQ600_23313 [Phytophthora cactorum]|nr:hypothetical protein GQ600_23313 [Phytophthora cactorum]